MNNGPWQGRAIRHRKLAGKAISHNPKKAMPWGALTVIPPLTAASLLSLSLSLSRRVSAARLSLSALLPSPASLPQCLVLIFEGEQLFLCGCSTPSRDWYNLEKSKRIKAFRSREHDACIKKARAYAVQSIRMGEKGRKYARREEAILHALDIEKASLKRGKGITSCHKVNGGSKPKLSQATLERIEDLNTVEVQVIQRERWTVQTDSDDDGAGGSIRMRDLDDLCLGTGSKGKVNAFGKGQTLPDSRLNNSMNKCNCRGKNRRRRLSKVLKSFAASVFMEDGDSSLSSINGSTMSNQACVSESAESKTKESSQAADAFLGGSSEEIFEPFDDGFLDVPVIWKEIQAGDFFGTRDSQRCCEEDMIESDDTLDENDSSSLDRETSDVSSDEQPGGSHPHASCKQRWVIAGPHGSSSRRRIEDVFNRPTVHKRPKKSTFSRNQSFSRLPALPRNDSSLYDVKLEVETSYRGPRVPLVSLMSRFNGKAIIGHPIAVEIVEDASMGEQNCSEDTSVDFFQRHKGHRPKSKRERMAFDRAKASENRRSGFLMRKIRRLSSLAADKTEGMAAAEKGRRTVACIPLSLVFKRINSALTSPSRLGNR